MTKPICWKGTALLCACALSVLGGCSSGPRAVRGTDEPGLDYAAMSTGLDRKDLQRMLDENMAVLEKSAVAQRWEQLAKEGFDRRASVAMLTLRNETSEHIDSALDALISDVETKLINWGYVRVVSLENRGQLMNELKVQGGEEFDQAKVATYGRQVGAQYFVTGKVYTTDERVEDQRRVQYYMFLQVIDVSTGEILFQNKTNTTKAIIRD